MTMLFQITHLLYKKTTIISLAGLDRFVRHRQRAGVWLTFYGQDCFELHREYVGGHIVGKK